jgi:nucleotide-binding universal stress UspA family protein
VPVTTVQEEGDVAPRILDQARDWPADVVVLGRTTRRGAGDPFIGIEAQRILEFCDRPVLVVPG